MVAETLPRLSHFTTVHKMVPLLIPCVDLSGVVAHFKTAEFPTKVFFNHSSTNCFGCSLPESLITGDGLLRVWYPKYMADQRLRTTALPHL